MHKVSGMRMPGENAGWTAASEAVDLESMVENYKICFENMAIAFAIVYVEPLGKEGYPDGFFVYLNQAFEDMEHMKRSESFTMAGKADRSRGPSFTEHYGNGKARQWLQFFGEIAYSRSAGTLNRTCTVQEKRYTIQSFCPALGYCCCVLTGTTQQYRQSEQIKKEIDSIKSIYELAMQVNRIHVWQYDIRTKTLYDNEESRAAHGWKESVIVNFPESVIEKGLVRDCSIEAMRDIFRRLEAGEERVEADIWYCNSKSNRYWLEHIIYITTLLPDCAEVQTIGIGREIEQEAIK